MSREPVPSYDPEYVRDISDAVYRVRLGPDDVARIEADEKRGPEYIRRSARNYDALTRAYLDSLNSIGLRQREAK